MNQPTILRVDGAVERPLDLTFADLRALPKAEQFEDISRYHPGRKGDGVTLEALLREARPQPGANYLTLHAEKDDFHVSIPLDAVRAEAVVVYRLGETPLGPEHGGPIRFWIRNPAACHTAELDDCANVKYLDRIELSVRRGRDTRPADEAAHQALHERQATPG